MSRAEALKLSRYHVAGRPFDDVDGKSKLLVFATRTGQARLIPTTHWEAIQLGALERLSDDDQAELVQIQLLVPETENELATVVSKNKAAIRSDDTLSLVIMPTASCQLGCEYCGQEHFLRWLTPQHQDQFLMQAASRLKLRDYRHLFVRWFGAEPLVGLRVIRMMSPRLKALAEEFGCSYGARIVTNGLALTPKVATELVRDCDVRLIDITLDGSREFHDARRYKKSGGPTFDRIFANLIALARRDDLKVQIRLRTNVDRHNCDGVSPLLRQIAAAGIQERVQYYVAPIHSWGNDAQREALPPEEFAAMELNWLSEMIELGFTPGLLPSVTKVVCMAVHPHDLLVDATGALFNCTEMPYVRQYGEPNRYAIGHVTTGETGNRRIMLGEFNERVERGEYPCSTCRMLPVCGGACPKAWSEGHPPCPSALYNIEGRLQLALRTARVADAGAGRN